jgi:hypothetical protein
LTNIEPENAMPAWLPVIKTAIPHIANIVTLALPMFTSKAGNERRDALTNQQIAELQDAAMQNAESVHELAAQLQTTFEALETAAAQTQQELTRQRQQTLLAVVLAAASLGVSTVVLLSA